MSAFIKSYRILFPLVVMLGGLFVSNSSYAGLCVVPKEA